MNEEKQTQKKSTVKNGDKLKNSSKAAQYAKGKFRTGRKDNSLTLEEKMELAKLRNRAEKQLRNKL